MPSPALDDYPPGSLLLLISILESFFSLFKLPQWREYMPFGLGETWLSHETPEPLSKIFPNLLTYSDFLSQTGSKVGPSSLYTFAFETDTTSLGVMTSMDALVTLTLLVLILRKMKRVANPFFSSIGTNFARRTHGDDWVQANDEKIVKFGEYVFRLIYHSALAIYGVLYFKDKPWWHKDQGGTSLVFLDYPNHTIETGMIWYYLVQSAYNVDAFISLLELSVDVKLQGLVNKNTKKFQGPLQFSWSKTARGDFSEMMVHHVITNCLVIGSSHCRFTKIGSMVFMMHDISDVPVDMSKLANFMKWKLATTVCFATLLIVWIITRLLIFPFVIIRSTFYESHLICIHGLVDVRHHLMYVGLFKLLLCAIASLHIWWFFIMGQICVKLVVKGEHHDLSEKKHGESQIIKKKAQ